MSKPIKSSHKGGSKKGRRQASNNKRGKYRKAFLSCVKRTGRWRGHPATADMLKGSAG